MEERFLRATEYVRQIPHGVDEPNQETKLIFYGLYKQATEGDCQSVEPWVIQVTAHAKWEAWMSKKGMKSSEAKQEYVNLLKTIAPKFEIR